MPGHGGPPNQSVVAARELYITAPEHIPLRQLVKQFAGKAGTSIQNLARISSEDDWPRQREEYQQDIAEAARRKSRSHQVKVFNQLYKGHEAMILLAAKALKHRDAEGEVMSFGTASTALMNHGRVLEEMADARPSPGTGSPEVVLTQDRIDGILAIKNPLDKKEITE